MSSGMSGAATGGLMTIVNLIVSIPIVFAAIIVGCLGYLGFTVIELVTYDPNQVVACEKKPIAVAQTSLTPSPCEAKAGAQHIATHP